MIRVQGPGRGDSEWGFVSKDEGDVVLLLSLKYVVQKKKYGVLPVHIVVPVFRRCSYPYLEVAFLCRTCSVRMFLLIVVRKGPTRRRVGVPEGPTRVGTEIRRHQRWTVDISGGGGATGEINAMRCGKDQRNAVRERNPGPTQRIPGPTQCGAGRTNPGWTNPGGPTERVDISGGGATRPGKEVNDLSSFLAGATRMFAIALPWSSRLGRPLCKRVVHCPVSYSLTVITFLYYV